MSAISAEELLGGFTTVQAVQASRLTSGELAHHGRPYSALLYRKLLDVTRMGAQQRKRNGVCWLFGDVSAFIRNKKKLCKLTFLGSYKLHTAETVTVPESSITFDEPGLTSRFVPS